MSPNEIYSLIEFLSFRTISSESSSEIHQCANWLKKYFLSLGLYSEVWETKNNPTVFSYTSHIEGAPTILIYGHYDVQAVENLGTWQYDPFKPQIKNNQIFARGAADNKGQIFYSFLAIKELIDKNELNLNVKFIIDGGEEIGSPGIKNIISSKKKN